MPSEVKPLLSSPICGVVILIIFLSLRSGESLSADDVLDDIGSMLADLTDELDAMLHSDKP